MGREARCQCDCGEQSATGVALLETNELLFRGPLKLKIPLDAITRVKAEGGRLVVQFGKQTATFHLGDQAPKWAQAILEPKGVLAKLGIKAGQRVLVTGLDDSAFLAQIEELQATVVKRGGKNLDHVFFAIATEDDLARLHGLVAALKPEGALWILRPKGPQGVKEGATREAGRAAGLVDVKVVGFSASYSAEKFVIPLSKR